MTANWNNTPLQLNRTSETTIYHITSGGTDTTYSMPSKIMECATALGMNVMGVSYASRAVTRLMRLFYRGEFNRLRGSGVPINAAGPLPNTYRKLVVSRVGSTRRWLPSIGLHYVMERPTGTVMEPSRGANYPSFSQFQTISRNLDSVGVHETSLTIILG